MANLSKVGYVSNIQDDSLQNDNFRKVLFTGSYSQLVVMSLLPGEEIGEEVHPNVDQFFRIEEGKGKVIMNGEETEFETEFAFVIPAGTTHNVINTGEGKLKLYTIYSPANHPANTVHATKADALADENDHV